VSTIESAKEQVEEIRDRRPLVDHLVRTVQHYGQVHGSALAAAVTYFAFLSFFPILALSFAVIGQVSKAYPRAQSDLLEAIDQVLPGMVGDGSGQVSLETLQGAAPGIFSVGLLLALYSGLGWLSGMREALMAVFEEPEREKPSFVMGKLRDLAALMILGSVLIVSVAVSGVATKVLEPILDALELGAAAGVLFWVVAVILGVAASALLFFAFFRLLASPDAPNRSLWSGALLGAIGFEILKQASTFLLKSTAEQPAFQAFGIALILLVWINYFSRIVVLAAAWAHMSPEARAIRDARLSVERAVKGPAIDVAAVAAASPDIATRGPATPADPRQDPRAAFAAGAAAMLALVAVVRRRAR